MSESTEFLRDLVEELKMDVSHRDEENGNLQTQIDALESQLESADEQIYELNMKITQLKDLMQDTYYKLGEMM